MLGYIPQTPLTAGELDQRVAFDRKVIARDPALGSEVVSWQPIAQTPEVWARCTDVRDLGRGGDEIAAQNALVRQARTTVLVRWRADVDTDMRVRWLNRNRTLQIVSKAQTRRGTGLELSCEEISAS